MVDFGRRPVGRLCYCMVIVVALGFGSGLAAGQSGIATTTVVDTVYQADGTTASGTLIITWPAFLTASGSVVAAGSTNTTLGANGALSVALVPNAGASPANVYYTVVYQLGPGEVRTEYWVVPTSSPTNLAGVRTTPGSGVAGQPVSMQYVNTELATKANDSAVVHLSGAETVTGAKSFSTSPTVPTPTTSTAIANKAYVDSSVSNVGGGNFLPTSGGTMTGPITLPGNPASALQASTKQYVDSGLAVKADLIAGVVPATELGTGLASSGSCLLGNGASGVWGSCGAGGGTGNLALNPVASQAIAQPVGTQFSTNNLANIRYVTASWNWAQTPADNLTTAGSKTIHLASCPLGMDTASAANYYTYKVYISGTGTPEAVPVTGGSCVPGAASGTITVTTSNAHAAGYTVGSASTGIQEAWNDAWTNDAGLNVSAETAPYVKLAADQQYNVYASIYLRGRGGILDGAGSLIACSTRDRCIYVGTTQGMPYVNHHKLYNLSGASTVNVDGVQVAGVAASSGTYAVTTASAHPFVVGDVVDCEYYSQTAGQHWASTVVSVPNSTSFTVHFGGSTFAAGTTTFGFCNLLNAFIENNSDHVVAQDINLFQSNPGGMGYFSFGIVNDNDQQFIVERAANRSSNIINATANWPLGAFIYQRIDQGNAGITYVHDSEFTGVNCATGGGNGMVITDTVCQGFPTYGVRYFGGLQPATFQNIYEESTGGSVNPLYGYASQAGFVVQGGTGTKILGAFPINGFEPGFATGGGGAAERTYFVVPRSSTLGYGPVLFAGWAEPANGITSIPVVWPSVELQSSTGQGMGTLTWDVLVTTGAGTPAPYQSGMYAIATNISGNCGTNGMCSFTDTQAAPGAYTVQGQQFAPVFWYWPVNLVINGATVLVEQVGADPSAVASQGTTGVSIVAEQCKSAGVAQRRSPIWISCLASENGGGSGSIATVLQEVDPSNNGPAVNSKGRLNLGSAIGTPNDLVTLQDSNLSKTLAAAGERPPNDAADMAIGVDQTGGLAERAANSITSYINAAPNSGATNFLERLTAAGKTFNVPVTLGTITGSTQCLHVSPAGAVSGTGADCGSGSGGVTVNTGVTSQVAMYSGNGAVSGDSALTDTGTTLSYAGTGGISAAGGAFSGNLTVNGQLLVAGPWTVSTPVPGTAMTAAGAGTSSIGISNDGYFYISPNAGAPQKIATSATSSYFTNLFQEDSYDLGQYVVGETTANPQSLHVYSSYTNSSTWQRTSVGFDTSDGYAVVKSENSSSGQAPGLGFWINNGSSPLKWVIDASGNLKPWQVETYTIGTFNATSGIGLRPATVYAAGNATSGSGFELGKFANNSYELCNDTSGTVINGLAVLTANGCAAKPASAVTSGVIGVVIANAGTSGTTTLVRTGSAYCSFDATATVVGDYVVASSVANSGGYPLCHDAGAAQPSGMQVLGRVLQATAGGTTAQMFFDMPGTNASSSTSSGVQLAWTCPVAGATTTGVSYCNWTLPANVTITQFDLAASTAPAGCTTYPTLQVWDGKANAEVGSFSIAMTSSGGSFYPVVTGSTNLAQGEYLRIKVTTGGSGCSPVPAGLVATVTYQMQN